ncbi:MAG: hypothetical protein PHS19_05905, partial [Eubacteriales bacterium]|nr:hypothetical protein [Eubacteriales bacterium]
MRGGDPLGKIRVCRWVESACSDVNRPAFGRYCSKENTTRRKNDSRRIYYPDLSQNETGHHGNARRIQWTDHH